MLLRRSRLRRGDLRAVARAPEIAVRAGTITADGELDFRGTPGVDRNAPVGFSSIALRFELQVPTPATSSSRRS